MKSLALSLFCLAPLSAAQTVQPLFVELREPVDYGFRASDGEVVRSALGDFDGDGLVDLWRTDVHLNRGEGRFEREATSASPNLDPTSTWFLEVFDLEGDGDLDVLGGRDLRVFRNNGAASFQPVLNVSLPSAWDTLIRSYGTAADFNGDGRMDFFFSGEGVDQFPVFDQWGFGSLYLSPGPGGITWNLKTLNNAVGGGIAMDIEPDGDLDLVGYDYNTAKWYVRHQTGPTSYPRSLISGPTVAGRPHFPADYDGDGLTDMIVSEEGLLNPHSPFDSRLWLNQGADTFAPGPAFPTGVRVILGTADLNGDGDTDLLARHDASDLVGLLNDGNANFSIHFLLPDAPATTASFADVDGDGDEDVVCHGSGVNVYQQVGPTQFQRDHGAFDGRTYDLEAAGDIDADGDPDVLVGDDFFVNDGTGFFERDAARNPGAFTTFLTACAFLDHDADGDLDLFLGRQASALAENDGTGHFSMVPGASFPSLATRPFFVRAADLSGDGLPDLLLLREGAGDEPELWENVGGGAFVARSHTLLPSGNLSGFDLGDVDGDGTLDVLASDALWTRPNPWPASGTVTFQAAPVPAGFVAEFLADADADGDLDAVTGGTLYRNPGNGLLQPADTTTTGICLGVGDLDADGDLDLLTLLDGTATAAWEVNDGVGLFLNGGTDVDGTGSVRRLSYAHLGLYAPPVLADVDLDGDCDMFWPPDDTHLFTNLTRGLVAHGISGPDKDLRISVYGPPSTLYVLVFAEASRVANLKWGRLFLDLSTQLPYVPIGNLDATGRIDLVFPVPNDPALAGRAFLGQAAVGSPLRFTNADWFRFDDL